jgi:hypothetical protein
MTRDEFLQLIARFAKRPIPSTEGRHVYVWQSTAEELDAKTLRGLVATLDLHKLCHALERTPSTTEAARRVLTDAIGKWLSQELVRDDRQRVLAVTGCDLLMRYRVSLSPFVQLASENRLVAFVVPADESRYKPNQSLPPYVRLQPNATLSYLKSHLGESAVIGE